MRRDYIIQIIESIVGSRVIAEAVVERLEEEQLLNLHYGNQDVGAIVEAFKDTFGTTKVTKYDRFAATRLAKKHGPESVVNIIKLLAAKSEEKYAPTVRDVAQLESKWVSVIRFLRDQSVNKEIEL